MPSGPTRRLIPPWLIIIIAVFVIVALAFVASGGLSALRQFSDVETTTKHTTYSKQGEVVTKEEETWSTQQRLTFWDALGLGFVPVAGAIIITIVSHTYNKRQREREEAVQTLRARTRR